MDSYRPGDSRRGYHHHPYRREDDNRRGRDSSIRGPAQKGPVRHPMMGRHAVQDAHRSRGGPAYRGNSEHLARGRRPADSTHDRNHNHDRRQSVGRSSQPRQTSSRSAEIRPSTHSSQSSTVPGPPYLGLITQNVDGIQPNEAELKNEYCFFCSSHRHNNPASLRAESCPDIHADTHKHTCMARFGKEMPSNYPWRIEAEIGGPEPVGEAELTNWLNHISLILKHVSQKYEKEVKARDTWCLDVLRSSEMSIKDKAQFRKLMTAVALLTRALCRLVVFDLWPYRKQMLQPLAEKIQDWPFVHHNKLGQVIDCPSRVLIDPQDPYKGSIANTAKVVPYLVNGSRCDGLKPFPVDQNLHDGYLSHYCRVVEAYRKAKGELNQHFVAFAAEWPEGTRQRGEIMAGFSSLPKIISMEDVSVQEAVQELGPHLIKFVDVNNLFTAARKLPVQPRPASGAAVTEHATNDPSTLGTQSSSATNTPSTSNMQNSSATKNNNSSKPPASLKADINPVNLTDISAVSTATTRPESSSPANNPWTPLPDTHGTILNHPQQQSVNSPSSTSSRNPFAGSSTLPQVQPSSGLRTPLERPFRK